MQRNTLPLALALVQPDETVGDDFEEWELTVNQGIQDVYKRQALDIQLFHKFVRTQHHDKAHGIEHKVHGCGKLEIRAGAAQALSLIHI